MYMVRYSLVLTSCSYPGNIIGYITCMVNRHRLRVHGRVDTDRSMHYIIACLIFDDDDN